jgi:hypothetical protein
VERSTDQRLVEYAAGVSGLQQPEWREARATAAEASGRIAVDNGAPLVVEAPRFFCDRSSSPASDAHFHSRDFELA